jgi:hypothetical protein
MMWRLFLVVFITLAAVSPAQASFVDFPMVRLQALDKSTARTVTLEANVGSTIEYGSIFIKIQACREAEPLETPESAAFIQVWEVPLNSKKSEWVFSGWMFASSPALSAMDHPVYDVWVLDCIDKNKQNSEALKAQSNEKISNQDDLEEPEAQPIIHDTGDDDDSRIVIDGALDTGVISVDEVEFGADDPFDAATDSLLNDSLDEMIIQYD